MCRARGTGEAECHITGLAVAVGGVIEIAIIAPAGLVCGVSVRCVGTYDFTDGIADVFVIFVAQALAGPI